MKRSGLLDQRPPGGIVVAVWGGPERPCRAPGTGHRASQRLRAAPWPFLPSFPALSLSLALSFFNFPCLPVFLPPSSLSFLFSASNSDRGAPRGTDLGESCSEPAARGWPPWGRWGRGGRARLSPPGRWAPRCAPARALAGCPLARGRSERFAVRPCYPKDGGKPSEAPRGRALPVAGRRAAVRSAAQPELGPRRIRGRGDVARLLGEVGAAGSAGACRGRRVGREEPGCAPSRHALDTAASLQNGPGGRAAWPGRREGARRSRSGGAGRGGLAAPSTRASGSHGRCSRAGPGDVATAAGAACGPRVPAAPSGALPGGTGGGWGPDPAGCRAPAVPAMRSARPGLPAAPTLTRRRSRGTAGSFRSVRARLGPQHPRAGAGRWRELTPSGRGANGSPSLQDTAATSDARLLKKHTQPCVRVAGRAPRLPAGRGCLAVRPQPALPGSAPCLAPRRAGTRGEPCGGTRGRGGAGLPSALYR